MFGVDTNVLLRWLLDDPSAPGQSELARRAVEEAPEEVMVGPVVLAELTWILETRFGFGRAPLTAMMRVILAAPMVVLPDRNAVELAVAAHEKGPPGFSDHLIATLNIAAGCATTLTFDKTAAKGPHFTLLT